MCFLLKLLSFFDFLSTKENPGWRIWFESSSQRTGSRLGDSGPLLNAEGAGLGDYGDGMLPSKQGACLAELSVSPLSHQGNLSLKDFDIRKEAGGVSFSAVEKVHMDHPFQPSVLFKIFFQLRKGLKNDEDEEFLGMASRPNTFSYAELRIATEDFNPANKLGEGGFGPVYKVSCYFLKLRTSFC
ncbi:hypothetical protein NE237_008313 [Protea cynaroides]|uniref:Uncharacterized protein n=1 Tax=Protea cynaroides TaxID=273540 RepID=A0A9Q0GL94_9MAGN|nr:hypothetical protein NE237_008313 [Protea cynaroides]